MTPVLLIHEDGRVERADAIEPLTYAKTAIADALDVNLAHHPLLEPRAYVLVIDDWGRTNGRPLNRKAWALYGGSPLYGPALFYRDDHDPIGDDVIALVTSSDFPGPELNTAMDAWLDEHPEAGR